METILDDLSWDHERDDDGFERPLVVCPRCLDTVEWLGGYFQECSACQADRQ